MEGEIEVEFIVGKDGILSDIVLKNDLGLGTGREAIRLVELMNSDDQLVWMPGEEDGKRVEVLETTTIPFRIDPAKKSKGKITSVDAAKIFLNGKAGLHQSLIADLKYPKGGDVNPCARGVIDVSFQIDPITDGITVVSMMDFNNLGKDFQSKARSYLLSSKGKWNNDLPSLTAKTTYKLSVPFNAKGQACSAGNEDYTQTIFTAMDAARSVSAKEKINDNLAFFDKAVRQFPSDNKLRYLQGMALYQCNRRVEACVNLSFVKQQNKNISVPFSCD